MLIFGVLALRCKIYVVAKHDEYACLEKIAGVHCTLSIPLT